MRFDQEIIVILPENQSDFTRKSVRFEQEIHVIAHEDLGDTSEMHLGQIFHTAVVTTPTCSNAFPMPRACVQVGARVSLLSTCPFAPGPSVRSVS